LEGEVAAAGDWKKGWSGWMSVYFVHLAGCASLNISCDKVFHVGPPVVRLYQLYCFCDSGVSSGF
jgi:hypothetical protein